jgi:hypothetical protein
MQREAAETFALRALAWLAGNAELLPVFLGASGATSDDLRRRAAEPEFLASVLDFLRLDDAWVIGFAAASGERPEAAAATLAAARRALPGGDTAFWT